MILLFSIGFSILTGLVILDRVYCKSKKKKKKKIVQAFYVIQIFYTQELITDQVRVPNEPGLSCKFFT